VTEERCEGTRAARRSASRLEAFTWSSTVCEGGRNDRKKNTNLHISRKTDDSTVAQFVIRRSGENKNTQAKRGGKGKTSAKVNTVLLVADPRSEDDEGQQCEK